jgi:hypothetical protein
VEFAAGVDVGLQAVLTADVFAMVIDVHVRADLAQLVEHAVAEAEVFGPE